MRVVRFDQGRIGVLGRDGVHDVTDLIPEWSSATADAAFNVFIERSGMLSSVIKARLTTAARPLDDVHLEAPAAPRQLLAAPRNYRPHQQEMTGALSAGGGSPADLGFFLKAPGSISGPAAAIELPPLQGRRFDYEGEVAVVVGRPARAIEPADALDYVFGYTILVDASMRMTESQREERTMRKSFHSFAPIGPWIVTRDEIPDPERLHLRLWLNGELRQEADVSDLIVDVPHLLAQASSVLTLLPGDVYATGTPAGVGAMVPGDRLTVEVGDIGRMELDVRERPW